MDIIYRYDPYKPMTPRNLADADAAIDVLRQGHDRYTTIVTRCTRKWWVMPPHPPARW